MGVKNERELLLKYTESVTWYDSYVDLYRWAMGNLRPHPKDFVVTFNPVGDWCLLYSF